MVLYVIPRIYNFSPRTLARSWNFWYICIKNKNMYIAVDLKTGEIRLFKNLTTLSDKLGLSVSTVYYNWKHKDFSFCVVEQYKIEKITLE